MSKKNWVKPGFVSLDIKETSHNWIGIYRDGGYIGDGEISGHLSWTKEEKEEEKTEDKLS